MLALFIVLAGCSSGPPSISDVERASLQPLKDRYAGVVMGFDPKGRELDVSIDLDGLSSIDEDAEDQLKRDAVAAWARAWRKGNPGLHGSLTMRMVDFKGGVIFKATENV